MQLLALMGIFLFSGAITAMPASASAPTVPALPEYSVTLTGYNAVPDQTSDHPFVTASGAYSNPEVVAARSRDLADQLPFGTIIEIKSPPDSQDDCGYNVVAPIIGYRVIADTMNARYADRIDVLFSTKSNYIMADGDTKNASAILGVCDSVAIQVVGHIDLAHSDQLPKTQAELAAIVNGTTLAINK
jgi:3D (Asp-Asp-Asp) domain-containing protein